MTGHGPYTHRAFGKLHDVPHAAVDDHASPPIVHRKQSKVAADQGAAIAATAINDQNAACTGRLEHLTHKRVVLEALQGGHRPADGSLAAVVLEHGRQNPQFARDEQRLVVIAKVRRWCRREGGCPGGARRICFLHDARKSTSPDGTCKNPGMNAILSLFLAALILAYVLEPISERLHAAGLGKSISALAALMAGIGASMGLVVLVLNVMSQELPQIKAKAPEWIERAQGWVAPQLERFDITLDWNHLKGLVIQRVTDQFSANADAIITRMIDTILASTQTFIAAIGTLVLIFFVVFYLLVDWGRLLTRASELVPPRYRDTARGLATECDGLLSQYLRGQLLVMLILAAYYALALSLIGMAGGLAIGLLTGLAIFIPYIGFGVGLILALISVLLQFGPSTEVLAVLGIYAAGQFLESFFLTPKLVGERIGLHPIAVIFALLFFGTLFGFFGVLLALPAAAITLVTLRFLGARYHQSRWFRGSGNEPPHNP